MRPVPLDDGPLQWVGAAEVIASDAGFSARRLPSSVDHQLDWMTKLAVDAPSGVRLSLRTDATAVEVDGLPVTLRFAQSAYRPPAVDLVVDGELVATDTRSGGVVVDVDPDDPMNSTLTDEGPVTFRLEGLEPTEKDLEIWLPPAGSMTVSALRVSREATIEPSTDDRSRWVHYGSSISQCGEAHSPARIWPAVAARAAGLHVTNLGLAGSCHLDQFAARYIRDLPADVISLKLGINVSNRASLIDRTFVPAFHGFVDTIRDGHQDTPIVVASPIVCPSAEDRPGPSENVDGLFRAAGDPAAIELGALTLRRIRELLAEGVEARRSLGDENIHYLDGLELFGPDDVDDLPDDLHPNGDGYERIGERFAELVFGPAGLVTVDRPGT